MIEHVWDWIPDGLKLRPQYFASEPEFGKPTHVFRSPFWMLELSLPIKGEEDRRKIETLFADMEGAGVVSVFDVRSMYPKRFQKVLRDGAPVSVVPSVTVKATSTSASTITVAGVDGDWISEGDALAFNDADGYRHYYVSKEKLVLDGTDQVLKVYLRPRRTLAGLDITVTRVKARQRFVISTNDVGGSTNTDGFTRYRLSGVEYYGAIEP